MTMRVLQVIGAMDRGGAETVIMNLYRAMDKERLQFDFLVHEQRECDYDAEIEAMGGRIYRLPRYTIANEAAYRRKCREHFENHPEHVVVHGHIGSSAAVYLSEAKRAGRATVLHSHAQNFDPFPQQQVFRMLAKRSLKWADWYLGCSPEAGLDRFGTAIVNGERYDIMNNGVDVGIYACDEEGHQAAKRDLGHADEVLVGHVGRFIPVKNHRFLIDFFREFHDMVPDSRLMLLGRGPLEDEVRSYAQEAGVGEAVTFCGVRDDVPRYMKAFDLFVFPSISEGLPMATVEAQAAGAPCLISTGVPSSAISFRGARRLPLDSGPAQWAQAAVALLEERVQRDEGGRDVRDNGYDIGQTAVWLAGLYEKLRDGAVDSGNRS